jgi:hypothetical protein
VDGCIYLIALVAALRKHGKKVIFFSFSACIAAAKQILFGAFSLVEYDGKEKPNCVTNT